LKISKLLPNFLLLDYTGYCEFPTSISCFSQILRILFSHRKNENIHTLYFLVVHYVVVVQAHSIYAKRSYYYTEDDLFQSIFGLPNGYHNVFICNTYLYTTTVTIYTYTRFVYLDSTPIRSPTLLLFPNAT